MIEFKKILKSIESNRVSLLLFFISVFIFLFFGSTRLSFTDEGIILSQFYNLINGSLALKFSKINITGGIYMFVGNDIYGKFSYSLLFFSLIPYYIFKGINLVYGFHLFILQFWALSGGVIVYLISKIRKLKYAEFGGILSYLILIILSLNFFEPIYFPKWGELLAIEFMNILISSFLVVFIYLFFKKFFGNKIGIFASLFVIFATPISFYSITLKHHSLALFLTILAFYFFHMSYEKKDNKYMYLAYIMAGFCIWTRVFDGAVLLASFLIIDTVIFRRGVKYSIYALIVILISIVPFLSLNYLIMGNPLSIAETFPIIDKSVKIPDANDFITLDKNQEIIQSQGELLNRLGYVNIPLQHVWNNTIINALFFRSVNTFGILLASPFLIIALAFMIERVKKKIELNIMDKFLGLYVLILFGSYFLMNILFNINAILYLILDTPVVLEYRYLLVMYIILLYFVFRINLIKYTVENNYKTIALLYSFILLISLIYFIREFPVSFMNIYYYIALATSITLMILLLINIFAQKSKSIAILSDRLLIFVIAFSLAEASVMMLFYYWVTSMTYISPSQNYALIPIMEKILKWMYPAIL